MELFGYSERGMVNSLCHRDYLAPESNKIAVFKNRIEIYNPGDFPEGLTPEDYIRKEEQSVLRNTLIAETLYKSRDIEKWGSGIKRIYNECKESGVKVEFKILKTGFMVVFNRKLVKSTPQVEGSARRERLVEIREKKVTKRVTEKVTKRVTENQKIIIKQMTDNPYVTTVELAKIIGISDRKIKENIRKLKEYGLVKRIGPANGGHWEIIKR